MWLVLSSEWMFFWAPLSPKFGTPSCDSWKKSSNMMLLRCGEYVNATVTSKYSSREPSSITGLQTVRIPRVHEPLERSSTEKWVPSMFHPCCDYVRLAGMREGFAFKRDSFSQFRQLVMLHSPSGSFQDVQMSTLVKGERWHIFLPSGPIPKQRG